MMYRIEPLLAAAFACVVAIGSIGCDSEPDSRFSGPFDELPGVQYTMFARSLATALNEGRPGDFDRAVDTRSLLAIAFANQGFSEDDLDGLSQIVPYGLALGDSIGSLVEGGGHYQAIMLHVVDGRPAVLFRLIQADAGFTYHDVIFGGTRETGPRIVDVFFYSTGEYLTETMGRMLAGGRTTVASRMLERFQERAPTVSPMRVALDSMRRLTSSGKPVLALRYFAELPEELRAEKLLLIERLGIARSVGEREADAAVRDMRRYHPNDVSLDLQLIDHFFLRNELDSTLATIDRLDSAVDGDPYLAYLRASIYRMRNDSLQMRTWAERALHGDRSLHYPYWMLLDISLVRRDYKLTYKLLRWLERFARYDVDDLAIEDDPRYEGFLRSKEHGEWQAWRERWHARMERYRNEKGSGEEIEPEDEPESPGLDTGVGPQPGV